MPVRRLPSRPLCRAVLAVWLLVAGCGTETGCGAATGSYEGSNDGCGTDCDCGSARSSRVGFSAATAALAPFFVVVRRPVVALRHASKLRFRYPVRMSHSGEAQVLPECGIHPGAPAQRRTLIAAVPWHCRECRWFSQSTESEFPHLRVRGFAGVGVSSCAMSVIWGWPATCNLLFCQTHVCKGIVDVAIMRIVWQHIVCDLVQRTRIWNLKLRCGSARQRSSVAVAVKAYTSKFALAMY